MPITQSFGFLEYRDMTPQEMQETSLAWEFLYREPPALLVQGEYKQYNDALQVVGSGTFQAPTFTTGFGGKGGYVGVKLPSGESWVGPVDAWEKVIFVMKDAKE